MARDLPRPTVGIVTALSKELSAVRVMLDKPEEIQLSGHGSGRRYLLGDIGDHLVVTALLLDTGNNSAAVRATQLLSHFPSVRQMVMCGIAGGVPAPGVPDDDVRLGDVVVSDRYGVIQYDFIGQTRERIEFRNPPRPPGPELIEAVNYLEEGRLRGDYPWEAYLERGHMIEGATRPSEDVGADGGPISYPFDSRRRPGFPRIFRGPIAAANRLLRDETFRDALRRKFKVKAVEMEGSGVADAAWAHDRSYLVVRGISDYCDARKGDVWQGYAAVAAAAYVRVLIERLGRSQKHDAPRRAALVAIGTLALVGGIVISRQDSDRGAERIGNEEERTTTRQGAPRQDQIAGALPSEAPPGVVITSITGQPSYALDFSPQNVMLLPVESPEPGVNGRLALVVMDLNVVNRGSAPATLKQLAATYEEENGTNEALEAELYSVAVGSLRDGKEALLLRRPRSSRLSPSVNVILLDWINATRKIGEKRLLVPGAVLNGGAVFLLAPQTHDPTKIKGLRVAIRDYSGNESHAVIEIGDDQLRFYREGLRLFDRRFRDRGSKEDVVFLDEE